MKYANIVVLTVFFAACAVVPQYALYQQDYFPDGVDDIYLGMAYKFMVKTRQQTTLEPVESADSTQLVFREVRPGNTFESLTYYFDNTAESQPLYEFSIDFPEDADPYYEAVRMYGEPNADEGEWFFETPEGFRINMWVEDQQIFLSAWETRNLD